MPDRGSFHRGTLLDAATGAAGEDVVLGSSELTTHGVIVGVTGSGKTGRNRSARGDAPRDRWKAVAEAVEAVAIRLEATDVRLVWVPLD